MGIVNHGRPYNYKGKPLKRVKRKITIRKKEPVIRIYGERDYCFLKYIRVVMKWAVEHSGLSRPEIETLLYLYSKGTFTKQEFFFYYKTVGMTTRWNLDRYITDGWIKQWRTGKRNMEGLFDLTSKAKIVCCKMHKMCVGEMDIPVSRRSNPLNKKKDVKVNAQYTLLFKQMNAERADRDKKKEEDE